MIINILKNRIQNNIQNYANRLRTIFIYLCKKTMAVNKLALLRYRIIDKCLQNRFKKWTLDDLIEEVSDALYEYEGIDSGVSKRTIQLDIQNMRSDKLGYNAPIIVVDRKYYSYTDKGYSITNSPLSENDVDKLNEVVSLLKQFSDFSYFNDLTALVTRLEDKVLSRKSPQKSPVQFDRNEMLSGTNWLKPLHQAIVKKTSLDMRYQSFKASEPKTYKVFPYLLKEYNNRWFLLCGVNKGVYIQTLALDRIKNLKEAPFEPFQEAKGIDVYTYFNNLIGVSKSPQHKPIEVLLKVTQKDLPYMKTKPMHTSQQIIEETEDFGLLKINVIWNFELEREILGRGDGIEVISPVRLRRKIKKRLQKNLGVYDG